MIPTEQEGTAAVDAAARVLYAADCAKAEGYAAAIGFPLPTFDDLEPLAQMTIRESVLPLVWAALEALPDRRPLAWNEGYDRGMRDEIGDIERADNPYGEPDPALFPLEEPETYLSWCDDGITLVCERAACMQPAVTGGHTFWFQEVLPPGKVTPAVAARAVTEHVLTHTET